MHGCESTEDPLVAQRCSGSGDTEEDDDVPLCMGEFIDSEGRVQHICDLCSDDNFCRAIATRACMCPLPGGAKRLSGSLAAAIALFTASVFVGMLTSVAPSGTVFDWWWPMFPTLLAWGFIAIGGLTLPRRRTNPCPNIIPPATALFVNWLFVALFGFLLVYARVSLQGPNQYSFRGWLERTVHVYVIGCA